MDCLSGTEFLFTSDGPLGRATSLDFWQWAFSDLKQNDIRGVFAEWIVASLLNIKHGTRRSWDAWDLQTDDGLKIEVKCAARLQAWHNEDSSPSRIVFSGLRSRLPQGGKYAEDATFNADIYIFSVQTETDPVRWNAFDLDQWVFYVVSSRELKNINQSSISIKTLQEKGVCALAARDLAEYVVHNRT